jgi:hypothetical protein
MALGIARRTGVHHVQQDEPAVILDRDIGCQVERSLGVIGAVGCYEYRLDG